MSLDSADTITVALRADQFDLLVMTLLHLNKLMNSQTTYSELETLARRVLYRRAHELIADLRDACPGAGEPLDKE